MKNSMTSFKKFIIAAIIFSITGTIFAENEAVEKEVTVSASVNLSTALNNLGIDINTITKLTIKTEEVALAVSGSLADATAIADFNILNGMEALKELDFSQDPNTTAIPNGAFENNSTIETITFPPNLTAIGSSVFNNSALKGILTFPAKFIDASQFQNRLMNCQYITGFEFHPDNSKFFNYDTNGNQCKSGGDGVAYIKYDDQRISLLLYPCGKTDKTYAVPEGVNVFARHSFFYNDTLKKIILPATFQGFMSKDDTFWYADSLETVEVAAGNNLFTAMDGVLVQLANGSDDAALLYCPRAIKAETITIDGSIITNTTRYNLRFEDGISQRFFGWADNLKKIVFTEGVETIAQEGVRHRTTNQGILEEVYLPSTIKTIGQDAFCQQIKMKTLVCRAVVPPTCGGNAFYDFPSTFRAYVPENSVADYKAKANWTLIATRINPYYNISIIDDNGTIESPIGTDIAYNGATVTITAATAPPGFIFDTWTTTNEDVVFDDESTETTAFTMPASDVVLIASYREKIVTWSGDTDNDWNNPSNWEEQLVPDEYSKVIIPTLSGSNINYPILTGENDETYACTSILFESGAEIGNQHLLSVTQDKGATVAFNFTNTDRWHMLSIPVDGITTGNFNFKALADPDNEPYSWLIKFEPIEDEEDNTKTVADWSYKGPSENLSFGEGFAVSIGKIGDNGVEGWPGGKSMSFSGNLWKEDDAIFETLPLDFGEDNNSDFALVGNPFMTSIDFDALYDDNKDAINQNYLIWTADENGTNEGFIGYAYGESYGITGYITGTSDKNIAPLQAFFVEKAEGAGDDITLSFDLASISGAGITGEGTLRTTMTDGYGKLDVIAKNGTVPVKTFITNKEGMKSARKLMNGCDAIPDIYTLSTDKTGAFGAQVINRNDITIPLGIATNTEGTMSLTFTGMSSYANMDINLYDVTEQKTLLLTGDSYEYEFDYTPPTKTIKDKNDKDVEVVIADENRFYLAFSPSSITGLDNTANGGISVCIKNNVLHAISTVTDPINEIGVYDMHGRPVYTANNLHIPVYTVNISEQKTICIVRVITESGVKNVKVINK